MIFEFKIRIEEDDLEGCGPILGTFFDSGGIYTLIEGACQYTSENMKIEVKELDEKQINVDFEPHKDS
jgi:hypothetical protein